MGIDPGTNRTGYGVIEVEGGKLSCKVLGIIELGRITDPYEKLKYIFTRVASLVEEFDPDEVAFESPFFGENVQSMLKLGRAQGVAMAAALSRGKSVAEYSPRRVKQAVTGVGSASKEQVARLLRSMMTFEYDPKRLDSTDGLAVAVCHHFVSSSPVQPVVTKHAKHKSVSWESFVGSNPDRIIK